MKITGVLARLVMHYFDQRYLEKLRMINVFPILYKRYVDDLNMGVKARRREGREGGEKLDCRTARKLREVANTVMPMSIVMEEDYPSKSPTGKLPILDMEMWVEGSTIYHQHYCKPMASRLQSGGYGQVSFPGLH